MKTELIKPLPHKEIEMPEWFAEDPQRILYWNKRMRLIFFDPKEIYERIDHLIDPFSRRQKLDMHTMFPKIEGFCACGCGKETKYKWANEICSGFGYVVYSIIAYGTPDARKLIETYYGSNCVECGASDRCDIDHIVPVKHGGGACWLSNFVPLCKECHKKKTKKDFNWAEFKIDTSNQIKINL